MASAPQVGSPTSQRPGVVVAATHSGGGKTTVTAAVARALRRRGLLVRPFKIGPDFIDPAYHREAADAASINLDVWMTGVDGVRRGYRRWSDGADISVIEAMGALYDGEGGTEHGSAAHIAKLLDVPVVVVLDVWGMTRTAAAILDGLRAFDPKVRIAGCVLNRVGSAAHARMVTEALPQRLRGLVVGAIPHRDELEIRERHLGLVTVDENATTAAAREDAFVCAGELLDLDKILSIAGTGGRRAAKPPAAPTIRSAAARLAVAGDRAFCFYYEENLLLLRAAGFELVPFRPTLDPQLPSGVDAVYLGGGYPESFAAELEANASLAAELRDRAAGGTPVYAECGGLMYLARSLTGFDGARHAMAGVLPLDVVMDPQHLAIGYVEVRARLASPLGKAGTTVRGQEFHQSRIARADIDATLYDVTASDGHSRTDGYRLRNVVASHLHLHFASNRAVVSNLLRSAVESSSRHAPP